MSAIGGSDGGGGSSSAMIIDGGDYSDITETSEVCLNVQWFLNVYSIYVFLFIQKKKDDKKTKAKSIKKSTLDSKGKGKAKSSSEKSATLYTIREARKYYRDFDLSVFTLLDIDIPEVLLATQKHDEFVRDDDKDETDDAEEKKGKEEEEKRFEVWNKTFAVEGVVGVPNNLTLIPLSQYLEQIFLLEDLEKKLQSKLKMQASATTPMFGRKAGVNEGRLDLGVGYLGTSMNRVSVNEIVMQFVSIVPSLLKIMERLATDLNMVRIGI